MFKEPKAQFAAVMALIGVFAVLTYAAFGGFVTPITYQAQASAPNSLDQR